MGGIIGKSAPVFQPGHLSGAHGMRIMPAMKPMHVLYVGGGAFSLCVALLWCMNVAILPWLGVFVTQGSPYIGGVPVLAALMYVLVWLYGAVLLKNDKAKKAPGFVMGLAYGVFLAALFIWVIPTVLSALTGNPAVHPGTGGVGDIGAGIGHRLFPSGPDLGFKPPLASLAEKPWWNVGDWQGRLIPFGIAFAATGLFIGLFSAGKDKD